MHLKLSSFFLMADEVKKYNKKIILFGAGVIGLSVTPHLLLGLGLEKFIECYVDNDSSKWGNVLNIGNIEVKVQPPNILNAIGDNVSVLINISRYAEVFEQLDKMECTRNMSAYIIPMMCINNYHNIGGKGLVNLKSIQLIPKKIHYIWMGGKSIPDNLKYCIDTWKRFCPDYEIIRWDETNYDICKNSYMKVAYEEKKYGFVADYARLDLLYEYGGLFMDTDVEVIRNLDNLLYQEAFTSVEKWQIINFGGCSGAIKGHPAIEAFLVGWNERNFMHEDGSYDFVSGGVIDTKIALEHGFLLNGKNQEILGMNIYTYDYFHPYDYMSGLTEKTDDTYTIHHFNGGWLSDDMKLVNKKTSEKYMDLCQRAKAEVES